MLPKIIKAIKKVVKLFSLLTKNKKRRKFIDKTFLDICENLSKLSHCVSKQVACVIVKDGRIVSTGVNGTATGYKNCDEEFNKKSFDRKSHHQWSLMYEIHAEMNAIMNAAKLGISIDNSVAYCNLEPCFECSKNLSMSGVKRIVYLKAYDMNNKEDVKKRDNYLKKVKVKMEKF